MPPQNDVGGGRATQDEGSEEALLTSLLFWPQAPRIRLGQTAMTQDEGFEEALFYQPPFLATGAHPPAQALNVSYFSSFLAGITHILGIFLPKSLILCRGCLAQPDFGCLWPEKEAGQ